MVVYIFQCIMKPVKNRIFCIDCQRAKMLFESKSKAINFIKFNSDEIKNESGIAPKRVYFCKSCGGWHVTSSVRPVSERRKIRNLIGKAYRLLGEMHWSQARRFLCYAEDSLRIVKERLLPSPFDDHLKSEISKAKKKLDNFVVKCKEKTSSSGPSPIFKFLDLNYNCIELEVEGMCDDLENEGTVYAVHPKLLAQYDNKFFYVICSSRLNAEELQVTKKLNGLDEEDDSIQTFVCHSLNMVEIKHSFISNCKNQYVNVADAFEGDIIAMWKSGMQLRVVERVYKSSKYKYFRFTHLDYWIMLAGRNIHFYLGRPIKYTCVVSTASLDVENVFYVFKRHVNIGTIAPQTPKLPLSLHT